MTAGLSAKFFLGIIFTSVSRRTIGPDVWREENLPANLVAGLQVFPIECLEILDIFGPVFTPIPARGNHPASIAGGLGAVDDLLGVL